MARGSYDYIVMKSVLGIGILAVVVGLVACGSSGEDSSGPKPSDGETVVQAPPVAAGEHAVVLVFGPDVLPSVQNRVTELVTKSAPLPVRSADANALPPTLPADSIVLSFGDTASGHPIDAPTEAEGFALRTGTVSGASLFVSRGHDSRATRTARTPC